jgi:CheY-like chemotaxis protein
MVHGILVQSGGALRIDSAPGHGTVVEAWLPRAAQTPSAGVAARPDAAERGSGTILVCDDAPAVRDFIADALEQAGYAVIAAASGAHALAVLEGDVPIDLLLVDFAMPAMNGGAVARLARERRPGLPVLLITGNPSEAALESDAAGLPMMRKPFKQAQIVAATARLLRSIDAGEGRAEPGGGA